jgi:hypothetical protein
MLAMGIKAVTVAPLLSWEFYLTLFENLFNDYQHLRNPILTLSAKIRQRKEAIRDTQSKNIEFEACTAE